jgi:hypothetical protein
MLHIMFFVSVLQHYLLWHYGYALVLYVRIYRNLAWFVTEFFSMSTLIRTFFSPFRRITEPPARTFDIAAWSTTFVINTLSRILGACIRASLLLGGVATLSLLTIISLVGYAFWLIAPVVSLGAILGGGYICITSLI